MSFDSKGSEIYYFAEVRNEDQHRKLQWQPGSRYADDPQGNEEWTANYQEVGADKELERTLKAKTQKQ